MKKLAMILAVAFTMGLATSTVTAGTKEKVSKKEAPKTEQKADCAKAKECSKEAKAGCCASKTVEKQAEKTK